MNFNEHLKKYLSDEFIESLENSLLEERTNSLILNTNKISNEEFQNLFKNIKPSSLIKNAYYFNKDEYGFGKSYLFDNGAYYLMDISSMVGPNLLDVDENDLVLDMCAAPGGKTIFLALKNKKINIIANDISFKRALTLSSNIEKMGLSNIFIICNDFKNNYLNYKEKFDHIILDAPCSGSGMFRKSFEMKNDWSYDKVKKCAIIQKELIDMAIYMLKNGGTILYSTCSFSYEENEEVIKYTLEKNKNIKLINIETNDNFYRSDLKETIHLFPNIFKSEGQFIAILKKDGIKEKNKTFTNNLIKNRHFLNYNFNEFNCEKTINDKIYFYKNININFKNLHVLRYGLDAFAVKKDRLIPSFHLAHYLDSKNSIQLTDSEFLKYIHGEEIIKKLNLEPNFYIVSFNNINLGFIYYTNGKMKNFYPKGLRH